MRRDIETRSKMDTHLAPGGEQEELIAQFLAAVEDLQGRATLRGANGVEVLLPEEMLAILVNAASELQRGRAVTLVPSDQLLTTQEGAGFLGVSRPAFVKMLEAGEIPFSKVGRHRRVTLEDPRTYAENERKKRS